MWQAAKILVIDDDGCRRHDLKVILDFLGEPAVTTGYRDWQAAAAEHGSGPEAFAAVVCGGDPPRSLRQCLQQIREWDKGCPVILAGAHAGPGEDWEPFLRRMVIGTLALPPTYARLLDLLHRARHYREATANAGREGSRPAHLFRSLVGASRKIEDLRKVIAQVAERDIPVLINGEPGTDKEVVARNLHYRSPRTRGPFVPVDCRAIPEELLEAELFGHEGGAFPGAASPRAGRFELAVGGTLFLDNVADLPLAIQVKLLRVLNEKRYRRAGGTEDVAADVRIIAASQPGLEERVQAGRFHEGLFFCLNGFAIDIPPLRQRCEDLPLLINELVSRLEGEKRGSIRFNSAAILSLCRHHWPGNVRELANLVERMAISHPCGVVGVNDLPEKYRHLDARDEDPERGITVERVTTGYRPTTVTMSDRALLPEAGIDLKEYLNSLERNLIRQALADMGGVVARAADHLAIRRTTLVEKMRKYGLQR